MPSTLTGRTLRRAGVATVLAVGLIGGGYGIAAAATSGSSSSTGTTSNQNVTPTATTTHHCPNMSGMTSS